MREFRQEHGRTGERYWQVWLESRQANSPLEYVCSAWGAINEDGTRNEHGNTKDRPGPKGKKGTKAHQTAADNAVFNMDRAIRKKIEEGYHEVGLDGRPLVGGSADEIDHEKELPKNLCFSKPKNTMPESKIAKLEAADDLIFTRKVNGAMVILHVDAHEVPTIYSRRMDHLTNHFPHLVQAAHDLKIPAESILLFEAFVGEGNTQEEFQEAQGIMRSNPDRAIKLQEKNRWMSFCLLRIPVWKGSFLEQINDNETQLFTIENVFSDRFLEYDHETAGLFLYTLEIFEGTVDEAMAHAKEHGYEGWVCYQRSEKLGAYSFSFHGKPDRPSSCFKLKPWLEDDFIAYWDPDERFSHGKQGSWGTGKNSKRVGTLSLYQHGPNGQGEVYVCEVGSGLSDEERRELTNPHRYPIVVEVKYQDRSYVSEGAKTNALTFPSVVKIREDKDPKECVNGRLTSPA